MKIFFLFFIIFVIVQWYLKMRQTRDFYKYYNSFLQEGDVLVGKQKGIYSGAIIMMKLDKKAYIQECMLISGASFFTKFKPFNELNKKNVLHINSDHFINYKKGVRGAIKNAIENYS